MVVDRRWLDPDTVDYSDLPQGPPVGRAVMRPARPVADVPPNMPDWPALAWHGNVRPDMPRETGRRDG